MMQYISERGEEHLGIIRFGDRPKAWGDTAPIELLARLPSEECGCPEELWNIEGLLYLIHLEDKAGTGEIFIFAGDWEQEYSVQADTLDALRAVMFAKHAEIMQADPN